MASSGVGAGAPRDARPAKHVVLFLGAGASRAFGHLLTVEIMPEIMKRLAKGAFADRRLVEHGDRLERFLRRVMPGIDGPAPPMITDVLSLLDHCLVNGEALSSEGDGRDDLLDARRLLDRAIVEVLDKPFHGDRTEPARLAEWVAARQAAGTAVTVISTNYDVSLDVALLSTLLGDFQRDYHKTDFGFTWRDLDDGEIVPPSRKPLVRLYKFHGSLNWLRCDRCSYVYVNFFGSVARLGGAAEASWSSTCHCEHRPLSAVLVAPSLVRDVRDRSLLAVWQRSLEAMRSADEWVFVGYSLPTEDVAIRSLLIRARLGHVSPGGPRVRVVDPSRAVLDRFAVVTPALQYAETGLAAFLDGTCVWR